MAVNWLKRRVISWSASLAYELLRMPEIDAELRGVLARNFGRDLKQARKNIVHLRRSVDALSEDAAAERFAALARPGAAVAVPSQRDSLRALLELLALAQPREHSFLDIGCGRSGGQSVFLAERLGWHGLFVDASELSVERLAQRLAALDGVEVRQVRVSSANVNDLADSLRARELDLLNIDIDSDDYWVWKALVARPRVAVVEYNAFLGHGAVTVPEGAVTEDSPKGYSGASLSALAKLGAEKGYRLVGCDHAGVNAYFLREDVAPVVPGVPAEQAWRPNLSRYELEEVPRAGEKLAAEIEALGLPLVAV